MFLLLVFEISLVFNWTKGQKRRTKTEGGVGIPKENLSQGHLLKLGINFSSRNPGKLEICWVIDLVLNKGICLSAELSFCLMIFNQEQEQSNDLEEQLGRNI